MRLASGLTQTIAVCIVPSIALQKYVAHFDSWLKNRFSLICSIQGYWVNLSSFWISRQNDCGEGEVPQVRFWRNSWDPNNILRKAQVFDQGLYKFKFPNYSRIRFRAIKYKPQTDLRSFAAASLKCNVFVTNLSERLSSEPCCLLLVAPASIASCLPHRADLKCMSQYFRLFVCRKVKVLNLTDIKIESILLSKHVPFYWQCKEHVLNKKKINVFICSK